KMRGYRIELGEIENHLQQLPTIQQALVLAQKDASGTQQLVAYLVVEGDFDKTAIQQSLKTQLPEYMIPPIIISLPEMPLTLNGKIDKKALPAPDLSNLSTKAYVAPSTPTQTCLVNIWQQLLEVERVGIHDDFFDLGGHSLLATRVISEIRTQLHVELSIRDLFHHTILHDLATFIEQQTPNTTLPQLVTQQRPQRIPLSYAQERLWFIDQLEGSLHYHIPRLFRINGAFNRVAFEQAFQMIVNRHELLRTVIRQEQGEAYQVVLPTDGWYLSYTPMRETERDESQLTAHVDQLINQPFDLSKDHPLRIDLIQVNETEHLVVMVTHHIASDGWSFAVLFNEFMELYHHLEKGDPVQWPPLNIQYADFAIWQRRYHDGAILEKQLTYWKTQLANLSALELPTDFPRPAIQSLKGDNRGLLIDANLTTQLQTLANEQEVTPFMLLLAAFKALLFKHCGQEDLSIGSPIAGRTIKEVEHLIGFFVNTLVIRSSLNANLPFSEFLNQVKQTTLDAFAHQMAPFEKVVEVLGVERDQSRDPIFQVAFAYQNMPQGSSELVNTLDIRPTAGSTVVTAQRDLSVFVEERANGLMVGINYCADLYRGSTIEQLLKHYQNLLRSIVAHPNLTLAELEMLDEAEQQQLNQFNALVRDYPQDQSVIEVFDNHVHQQATQPALLFQDREWTYQSLNFAAEEVAAYLQNVHHVQAGDFVGILLERSEWMIIALLGVLKAGAIYVPMSPAHPLDRKQFVVDDTQMKVLIHTDAQAAVIASLAVHPFPIDQGLQQKASLHFQAVPIQANAPVYLIYTSGTTGQPKGTLVSHRNLLNLTQASPDIAYQPGDRVLQWSNFTFDGSVFDIFNALLNGATLAMITEQDVADPVRLKALINQYQINAGLITTALFNAFVDYDVSTFTHFRKLFFGGEAGSVEHAKKAIRAMGPNQLINAYGPTEATVMATYYQVQSDQFQQLPIGQPLANTFIYVVNEVGQQAGIGVVGEIWIGGDAVALGYWNRPTLNEQQFIDDPFRSVAGARIYKTGDLGRWRSDGQLEFMGRRDHQVKIRGYRIELGAIEQLLQVCPLVQQAVVAALDDPAGTKRLVAYVVAKGAFDKAAIQQYLHQQLPEYMIPAILLEVESFPITVNGKINRALLPAPDFSALTTQTYIAPRNELEIQISEIWLELLQLERIGIRDNFFEMGGHSLLATRVIAQLEDRLTITLSIRDLFQHPTIEQLANFIEQNQQHALIPRLVPQERTERIPLSFAQERLWFVDQLGGSLQYHTPHLLQLKGSLQLEEFCQAFELLVQRHELLRTLIQKEQGQAHQVITAGKDWQVQYLEKAPFQNLEEQ
ncbi:MAG: amino acid adenylation domain-containing protein, partial [Bacteroidota bacterium]